MISFFSFVISVSSFRVVDDERGTRIFINFFHSKQVPFQYPNGFHAKKDHTDSFLLEKELFIVLHPVSRRVLQSDCSSCNKNFGAIRPTS